MFPLQLPALSCLKVVRAVQWGSSANRYGSQCAKKVWNLDAQAIAKLAWFMKWKSFENIARTLIRTQRIKMSPKRRKIKWLSQFVLITFIVLFCNTLNKKLKKSVSRTWNGSKFIYFRRERPENKNRLVNSPFYNESKWLFPCVAIYQLSIKDHNEVIIAPSRQSV